MKRLKRLLFAGLMLCGFTIILLMTNQPDKLHAQDESSDYPPYMGADECSACHPGLARDHDGTRHALALQDGSVSQADFGAGEDIRTVQFPDGTRPFTKEDVALVMGSGRYVERYVYQLDGGGYAVLPAEWNVEAAAWQPFTMGENWPQDYDWLQNCAGCHTTGLDLTTGEWVDNGVQCENCHGPGGQHVQMADFLPRRASDEDIDELRSKIVLSPDPQICGRCHSRGMDADGIHPYPVSYEPGGDLLTSYTLVAPDDEAHYWSTGHARSSNMQFNEWFNSAHSTSLETLRSSASAEDACLQCHSGDYRWTQDQIAIYADLDGTPPQPLTVDTAQFGLTCVNCHNPHSEEPTDFFLRTDSSYAICTECHQETDVYDGIHHPVQQMFEGQSIIAGVDGVASNHFAAFTTGEGPECITCHMTKVPVDGLASHALKVVLPGPEDEGLTGACTGCHTDLASADLKYLVEDTQNVVRDRLTVAIARLSSVEAPAPDSEGFDIYNHVLTAITFVQNDGSLGFHNYDYSDSLLGYAEHQLTELSVPMANFEPTEAPAPTAIPDGPILAATPLTEESVEGGFRPITWIIIGLTGIVLFMAAVSFYRSAANKGANA